MNKPILVTVEGSIGAGKSTLLKKLAEARKDVIVVQEPVSTWSKPVLPDGSSMLEAYYARPKETSMAFQMFAMLTRVQQISDAVERAKATNARFIVTERCSWSDYEIFGRPMHEMGVLSDADFFTYTSWFHSVTDVGSGFIGGIRPSALFYLRCPPETCLARIKGRDRKGEEKISLEYLEKLHEAHERYSYESRKEGSGFDLVNVVEIAHESRPSHTYYNGLSTPDGLEELVHLMRALLG